MNNFYPTKTETTCCNTQGNTFSLKLRTQWLATALAFFVFTIQGFSQVNLGGVNLGNLPNYYMFFGDARYDANWQGASKGFVGNVVIDGIQASERTSGTVPYAGTIYTNDNSLNAWQSIITSNSGQANSSLNQTTLVNNLTSDLENVFTQVNALSATSGYSSVSSASLDGLNTQNGTAQVFVINVTSGFSVSTQINITGDANDFFILRWDTDANFSDGYEGQVKFQSGGAIVPKGALKATNFIHVAGDLNSSGGGSNPASPYPQGPRLNSGTGSLISGGSDFSGGGFFTGYWFTTGAPTYNPGGEQPYGNQSSLSNAIFVGGWYSKCKQFSMTSGTSGVYVTPPTGGCDNVTSPGQIAGGGTGCSPYDPPLITSVSLPTGGSGTIEYVWIYRTYNGSWSSWSSPIPGANSSTYDPGPITIKTQFRRCARRSGCTSYVGESNDITFYVDGSISVSCSKTDGNCSNGNVGSVTATPSGGSSYTYLWSNGATTQTISNLAAGTYSVTVTSGGCTATCSKTVSVTGCCNVTSPGEIAGGGSGCSPFDPALITSVSLPSGGTGTIEYVWIKRTWNGSSWSSWAMISGANGPTYNPDPITVKTQFRRCARRSGCTDYVGESNILEYDVTTCIQPPSSPNCAQGNLLWENNIDVNNLQGSNGIPQADVRFVDGTLTSYTIPGPYPAAFNGPVQVSVTEAVSWDAYLTRASTGSQPNEQWKVVFKKSGSVVYQTPYTVDLATGVMAAEWKGSLGGQVVLPNGVDEIILVHYEDPTYGSGSASSANSVVPVSVCIAYQNVCETLDFSAEVNGPDCDGGDVCNLNSFSLSGHSIWLNSIAGTTNQYHFVGNGKFVQFSDGTAHISGVVQNDNNANKKWVVNMWFSDAMDWAAWSALGRTWKGTASIVGNNYLNWTYYIFDPSKNSSLTGLGDFAGKKINLTHRPSDYSMGLQIGVAANDKNGNFGMSTWFDFSGSYSGIGDLNVNADCQENQCNGAADLTVSNGTAPYTFSWSNGSSAEDLSGVCPGTYTVTVTDANGCPGQYSITIPGSSSPVVATCSPTNGNCNNNNLGSASVSASGGTAPYTYLWSNGATTSSISGLAAGTYSVGVTDANGCNASCSVTITITGCCNVNTPGEIGYDEQHCGEFDPQEIVSLSSPTGGLGSLEIVWIKRTWNGSAWGSWSMISGATGLSYDPGVITVSTQFRRCARRSGCTDYIGETNIITKTVNPSPVLTCNMTDVTTYGGTNGTAAITVTGGTPPYSYVWNNGSTATSLNNVPAGVYSVTVTDANGCSAWIECCVKQPPFDCLGLRTQTQGGWGQCQQNGNNPGTYLFANFAGAFPSGLSVGCNNFLNLTSAQAVCEFLPSGSTPAALPPGTLTNPGGTYNNVFAGQYVALTLNIGFDLYDANFAPATNNLKDLLINSGTFAGWTVQELYEEAGRKLGGCASSYSYSQLNQAVTAVNENFVDGDVTGSYLSCCGNLSANCSSQPVDCNGSSSGSVSVSVSGAAGAVTYLWSNGATTASVNNLPVGTYSVTVKDSRNCTATCSVTVQQPSELNANCSSTNAGCFGAATGTASVNASGGTAPYSYLWNNGGTTATISGLVAGTYSVTVTDANGCSKNCSTTVGQPNEIVAQCSGSDLLCFGAQTGTASVTVTGGTAPYSYLWSNGATTASLSGLSAGTYTVTVTDANGCTSSSPELPSNVCSVNVNQPSDLTANCNKTDADCNGSSTGGVSVSANGGTAPYSYLWNNGATTSSVNNLAAGIYSVTVTDANGCTETCSATVGQPSDLTANCNKTDANCYGASTGSVSVSANGGTAPYSYLWSNGATTASVNNLAAGAYSVTVTDANGCTETCSATVGQPSDLTANCNKTDADCYGASTGSVSVSANGGTAPYSYLWSNGATTASVNNLAAGAYSVTVTDANGCTETCSVTVGQSSELTASCSKENGTCNNNNQGSVSVVANGGIAPYSYLWNTGATTASISGLGAGTYSVTVTDANGCTATCSKTVTITPCCNVNQPGEIGYDEQNCGSFDPQEIVSISPPTGGLGSLEIVWIKRTWNGSSWSAWTVISGASGLSYDPGVITVTTQYRRCARRSGCTDYIGETNIITKTVNPSPNAQCSKTDADCYGASTGSVSVSANGGTAPYSYLWSNGATTASVNNLAAGTYSVTVTDANGCTETCSATVGQPSDLTANCNKTDANCYGASTGSVSVSANGGTSPYSYLWSNGATTSSVSNLSAGTYSVTVTDANGCTETCSTTVGQPSDLTAECSRVNGTCTNGNLGSVSVTANGGTAPYSYLWSNGSTEASISGLAAGTYSVTVTDANGCTETCSKTVTITPCCNVNNGGTIGYDQENCGPFDAAELVNVTFPSGGLGELEYVWLYNYNNVPFNNGSNGWVEIPNSNSPNYDPGVITQTTCFIRCSRRSGCEPYPGESNVICIVINPIPEATCSKTDVLCNGEATGTASVSVTGGTTPYSYLWSNGATTASISGLAADTYSVTVTDAEGCSDNCSVTVGEPSGALTAECSRTNGTCTNGNLGSVSVVANGGTAPYSYLWSNGSTEASISGLAAGTYSVTVTDANGCTATCSKTVTITPCCNVNNGGTIGYDQENCGPFDAAELVNVTFPSGGLGELEYVWLYNYNNVPFNNGSNGWVEIPNSNSPNYDPGVITQTTCFIRCSRRSGCEPYPGESNVICIVINPVPEATCSSTDAGCNGSQTGTVSVSVTGGTAPYSYLWSSGATTASVNGVAAGSYSVTVTDSKGCTASCSTSVSEPSGLSATCSSTDVACNGALTGTASVTVSGGTSPYSYLWSNGATTSSLSNLAAGTYSVTVTDANGCTYNCSSTVSEPSDLTANCNKTDADCNGASTGSVSVSANGGISPYSYLWSNGATTSSVSNLAAGTYSVTVTDANGCTETCSATVGEPGDLTANCSSTNVGCFGAATGTASVTAGGGTAPYSYLWNNGGTTATISGLIAGTYSVTVTDANGCSKNCSTTVGEPNEIVAECSATDVECNGAQTGTASVTVTGGTQPYSYLWSNGATTASISGLAAGTYTVTVMDANGCTSSSPELPSNVCSVTVNEPSDLTAECSSTNGTCTNGNLGSVSVVANGGTAPYSYLWSNGSTEASISGLAAGTYSVTVTDANGCTETCSKTVTITPCCNVNNGGTIGYDQENCGPFDAAELVNVTLPSGGLGELEYVWLYNYNQVPFNNGSNGWVEIPNSNSPNYDPGVITQTTCFIRCSRRSGCDPYVGESNVVCIIINPIPEATCSKTDVLCNGEATGTASVSVTGGTSPYSYQWSNGATTASISNLAAGTYSVTVTDAEGCSDNCSVTVGEPESGLSATCSSTDAGCNGAQDGTASVSASGGTSPYSYVWSNGATAASISGLAAGTYSVTVTDANGCTYSCSTEVGQPSGLSASCSSTDVACNGAATGTASVSANGGTSPYSYLWSNGATAASISGLAAGTYSVTVTDANGCSYSCSSTVNEPSDLTADCSSTDVDCNGAQNGTASVTAGGGTAPYSYLWNNGSTEASISGLAAGTYSVTVTDGNGCTETCSATVGQPDQLVAECSRVNGTCTNGNLGSVSVAVNGGTSPYSYLWSNGSTEASISGLAAGTYSVTVTDAKGCTVSCSKTVTTVPCCNVNTPGAIGYNQENCGPFDPAELVNILLPTGGIGELEYVWITTTDCSLPVTQWDMIPNSNSPNYDPGTVTETTCFIRCVRRSGCTEYIGESNRVTITVNPIPVPECSSEPAACYGSQTGSASVSVTGGTAPFSYLWSNGGTTATINGLAAGTYSVTVTDSEGCSGECSVEVGQSNDLTAECSGTPVSCQGDNTGSASVTVSGGTSPYSYEWSNGETTASISNLAAGTYTVVVSDANECETTCTYEVEEPEEYHVECSSTDVLCYGASTGTVTVTANGGTAPYSYLWSNGSTDASVSGLEAGIYSVTVTDANGCVELCSAVINQPEELIASTEAGSVLCYGDETGEAVVLAQWGTAPYSYLWSNGATDAAINGLAAGSYSVTVTDANGCTATASALVTGPESELGVQCDGEDASCFEAQDGTASAGAYGGTAPYTYEWSNGATGESISGLAAGTYTVTVYDANECMATCTVEVGEPQQLIASTEAGSVLCYGDETGEAVVLAQWGTAPYSYLWSNGATDASIDGLAAGSYSVTVTDANGCTASADALVTGPQSALGVECDGEDASCFEAQDGTASAGAYGGTAPYTYEWSNGATGESISGLAAGTYTVTVYDANECMATCTVEVGEPQQLIASTEAGSVLCYGDETGEAVVLAQWGTAPYSYLWSNGATDASIDGLAAGSYSVTVTDANGCTATADALVTGPQSELGVECDGEDASCFEAQNGTASAGAYGGTAPYTYEWSNGATGESISSLAAGTYTVTVYDANECMATCTVEIGQSNNLVAECSGTAVSCQGDNTGSASVSVTGGTEPYSYEWSNGGTDASISGLVAGTYTVVVTDANECQTTCTYEVEEPEEYHAQCSSTDVLCYGASTGSVSVTVNGGTSPYTYLWSNGATDASVSDLPAGIYSVTVTDANECIELCTSVISQPESGLNPVCDGEDVSCFGAQDGEASVTVSGGTEPYTYLWSNSSTDASISGLAPGTYSVTVYDANQCSASCSVEVGEPQPVEVEITADGPTTFCEGGSVTLTADGGFIAYVWTPTGETTQSIVVTEAGDYSVWVMDEGGCEGTSNTITVTVNPNPTPEVDADGPTTFCEGECVTLTSTEAASYLWSNGATTQSITVCEEGSFTVTVTDENGCEGTSAPVDVTIYPVEPPVVDADGPTSFCEGDCVTLTALYNGEVGSFVWSPNGETSQTITVCEGGSYTVTLIDENGCMSTSEPVVVTVYPNPTPEVDADGPTEFCQGNCVTLTSSEAASYLWSNGETTQSITVCESGSFTVTVTDENDCEGTSEPVDVTVYPVTPPEIDADGPTTFCDGECVTLTALYQGETGSFLWSNGETSQSITVCEGGSYTVTVTDENGCEATSEPVDVTVNPNPTPEITPDGPTTLCEGDCVTLTSSEAASYLWSNGETTQSITVCEEGAYFVTVFDENGCRGNAGPVNVTVNTPQPPTVTADGPTTMCEGECVTLTSTEAASYLWSNGETTQSITVCGEGEYSVSIVDENGCEADSDPVTVVVLPNPDPEITVDGPTTFCEGGCVTLTATYSGELGIFVWSNGATTQSITVCEEGDYYVTVTDENGCSGTSSDTVTVEIGEPVAPTVTADGPTEFCEGESVTLTANSPNAVSYQWYENGIAIPGATGQSITVSNFADYYVVVTDEFGCVAQSNLVLVKVGEIPEANAGEDVTICPGAEVVLTCTGGEYFVWSTGETTQSITVSPDEETTYTVTVTNPFCTQDATDDVTVSISTLPIAAIEASDDPSLGNPVNFTDVSGDNTIVNWLWDFGDGTTAITQNTHHTYDQEGTYTVILTVTNEIGCSGYDTVQIDINQVILIPNIITPNNDGFNDALGIKNNGVDNYGITIFNRWGQIVFEREAREITWNGTTNSGAEVEAGTYFYILKVKNTNGKPDFEKTGFITLVR